jgi:hypothetical protein
MSPNSRPEYRKMGNEYCVPHLKPAEEETPEVCRQDLWAVGASPSSLPP